MGTIASCCASLRRPRSVSRLYVIPSARRLDRLVSLRRFYVSVYDTNVPSPVASLFSWRCLAASTSSFLHVAMNLRPPSLTVLTHNSAFNAVAFQPPAMPTTRMSLCTESVHSFYFSPRPFRTASSMFPNTIDFGSRPRLIRMNAPTHKSLLVRNVVSTISHPVLSRPRLYEVTRWFGLLCCAPMMRSNSGGVRCGVWSSIPDEGSTYGIHTAEPQLLWLLIFGS